MRVPGGGEGPGLQLHALRPPPSKTGAQARGCTSGDRGPAVSATAMTFSTRNMQF